VRLLVCLGYVPGGTGSTKTQLMDGDARVIEIRLNSASEMFELAPTDLFSEFRNYLTGVEMCLSELRSRASRGAVKLVVSLPAAAVDEHTSRHIARTLRAFCDQRLSYNRREQRAVRFDGVAALRVGLPITVVGLVLTAYAARMAEASNEVIQAITDHLGWVLAWVGIWFPLDVFFFYPLQYQRENRALEVLRVADVEVRIAAPVVP
jgi:hypothetical protein